MEFRKPLYSLYNKSLQQRLKHGPMPRHVGVILDGNRRFAKSMRYDDVSLGHWAGFSKIDELMEWCAELEIPVVTLWLLSTDNFRRSQAEVTNLLSIIEAKIVQLTFSPLTYERRYRIRVLGRQEILPASTRVAIREIEDRTREHDGPIVNLAVGYGGREEIVDAVTQLIRDRAVKGEAIDDIASTLTAAEVGERLYTADLPDPDLIIRTSGEVRLSGFLLWQSAHSEFYFCDANWPAFRKVDFLRALRSYQQRQRRFGADAPPEAIDVEGRELRRDSPTAAARFSSVRLFTSELAIQPTKAPEFIDITEDVAAIVRGTGVQTGVVQLNSMHTTAGLTINENEPLLIGDMSRFLDRMAPANNEYAHNDFTVRTVNMTDDESPNGHSHCQQLLLNSSESIPVRNGAMLLGTWQRLFLVELDQARPRKVVVQVFGE
jgi:short-chain Z-isoprenyl diphosphate synthase